MNRHAFFSADFVQPPQAATLSVRAERRIYLPGYLRTLVRNSTSQVSSGPRTLHTLVRGAHATRLLI